MLTKKYGLHCHKIPNTDAKAVQLVLKLSKYFKRLGQLLKNKLRPPNQKLIRKSSDQLKCKT